jgi:hypothetical protein
MLHVIVDTDTEAYYAVMRMMAMKTDKDGGRSVQVEINGHVMVGGRRVASHSRRPVALLGVLATPFDLGRLGRDASDEIELLDQA